MSSANNVFPTLSRGEQAAVWITIVVLGLWLLVGVPTLIGVGWNRTSNVSTTSQASVSGLQSLTEGGFAQQNNAVQRNFRLATSLPSATLNIGGADGNANALTLSGDVSLANTGAVTINRGAVKNSQLANPAQYIVSTFPPDLPPVPIWRNSLLSGFTTGTLSSSFPFDTCGFAVSVVVRNVPSITSTPSLDVDSTLMNLGGRFRLKLLASNVLELYDLTASAVIVQAPVPASVANRAIWTVFSVQQSFTPGSSGGWVYNIFADNLVIGSVTVPLPLAAATNAAWSFCVPAVAPPQELAGVYIFFAADPNQPTLGVGNLARLLVIGPGNTFSSKLNSASLAAYEFYNTPGYPALNTAQVEQSFNFTLAPFPSNPFPLVAAQAGLAYTTYKNETLAMLQPDRFSSLLVNFSMPGNVSTVTVTLLIEVVVPFDAVAIPSSSPLTLVFYGATIGQDIYNVPFNVFTDISEQTIVIPGIPTTSNTEIGQKWTAELVRDDIVSADPNLIWIGVKSFIIQGNVA
jgi:hypothetical protein